MNRRKSGTIVFLGVLAFLATPVILSAQQAQKPSIVEAARKAREEQKKAPKAPVVWTNENIPTTPGSISVVGQAGPSASATTAEAKPAAPQAAKPEEKEKLATQRSQLEGSLTNAKAELKSLETDLNILQRKYALDAAQYYGTPGYSANQQGQANLDAEKAQIASKQQAVDAAQAKVNDLQKQLDALQEKEPSTTKPQ